MEERYIQSIKHYYGEGLLSEEDTLISYQNNTERLRRKLNSCFVADNYADIHEKLLPKYLLLRITNNCSIYCRHCYADCSPGNDNAIFHSIFKKLYSNDYFKHIQKVHLSGGEPFLSKYLFKYIEIFPVTAIFTNGFWGSTTIQTEKKLNKFYHALCQNKNISFDNFTFYISTDKMHSEHVPLSNVFNIIDYFIKKLPKINIAISCSDFVNDKTIEKLLAILEKNGYYVTCTEDKKGAVINVKLYSISKFEDFSYAKIFRIEIFKTDFIGRALYIKDEISSYDYNVFNYDEIKKDSKSTISDYGYVISSDGKIAPLEIFLIDPYPYYLGNLNTESWEEIIEKASNDPIIFSLKMYRYKEIKDISIKYFGSTVIDIYKKCKTDRLALYLVFLNSVRKIFINLFLLKKNILENKIRLKQVNSYSNSLYSFLLNCNDKELLEFSKNIIKEFSNGNESINYGLQ